MMAGIIMEVDAVDQGYCGVIWGSAFVLVSGM